MQRSLSLLLLLATMSIAFITASWEAPAQTPVSNSCCTFTVDVANIPLTCFPLRLTTVWFGGAQNNLPPGNGVFTFPIAFTACPPAPSSFFWASLDNNNAACKAWFGLPAECMVGNCCCMIRIGTTLSGCITVTIRPC